jgi:hypothetical protein
MPRRLGIPQLSEGDRDLVRTFDPDAAGTVSGRPVYSGPFPFPNASLSTLMNRRELYGKKAMECLLAADGMANAENRVAMLTLAKFWSRLGFRSDEIADHRSVSGCDLAHTSAVRFGGNLIDN